MRERTAGAGRGDSRSTWRRSLTAVVAVAVSIALLGGVVGTGVAPVDDAGETILAVGSTVLDDVDDAIGEAISDDASTGPGGGSNGADRAAMVDRNATDTPVDEGEIELEIHAAVNEARTTRGLEALEWDDDLREVAYYHSHRMGTEGFFSHTAPDGETLGDRYDRFDYVCRAGIRGLFQRSGGENLALTYHDSPIEGGERLTDEAELAESAVEGWLESPDHRENMLAEQWSVQGIGVYVTDDREVYATQNFC